MAKLRPDEKTLVRALLASGRIDRESMQGALGHLTIVLAYAEADGEPRTFTTQMGAHASGAGSMPVPIELAAFKGKVWERTVTLDPNVQQ